MKKIIPAFVLVVCSLLSSAQESATKWRANFEGEKVFIENKAQFDELNKTAGNPVLFATEETPFQVLFTKNGLTYRLQKMEKKKIEEPKHEKEKFLSEEEEHSAEMRADFVKMEWLNCNPDAEVIGEAPVTHYYSFQNVKRAGAFQKVLYKNLYNHIDVEYVFHPTEGIEYSFILHPGADVSQIRMKYSDISKVTTDESGNIHLRTIFGDIIDHAPLTAYSGLADNSSIPSRFVQKGKIISFQLDGYNNTQEAIIDPWTTSPALPSTNVVYYIKSDTAGNAYIYGGTQPICLKKYDKTGALLWTYSTPWTGGNFSFGPLATDKRGNSYISNGGGCAVTKIDSSGAYVWSGTTPNGPPTNPSIEFWCSDFNCDETELYLGGSRHNLQFSLPPSFDFEGTIFKMNLSNGSVAGYVNVVHPGSGVFAMNINEVRSLCSSPNGNMYFLSLDTVGGITPGLTVQAERLSGYHFPYYMPYSAGGGSDGQGQNNVRANSLYIYSTNGDTLHKRDINTGAILASAGLNGSANNNSGVAIDSCGNVYAGSQGRVLKFDANLNFLSSATVPEAVYDVSIGSNGDVFACGHNFAVALSMGACSPIERICFTVFSATATGNNASCNLCNGSATANPVTGSSPYTYLWSNNATTQTINGLCAGTYTVTITDAASSTASASVTLIQTGGNGTFALTAGPTTICPGDSSLLCAPTGYTTYQWNTGATTQCIQAKQAGNYYATVTDGGGCSLTSNHVALNVYPQPPVSISVNGDTLTAYNSSTYQWYLNSNPIPGATSNMWVATQNGSYQVAITDTNGCIAFSNAVVLSTGINGVWGGEGISVYPNPLTTGSWNLDVTSDLIGGKVELFDAEGRLVYEAVIRNLKSQLELNAAKGVYLMKVSSGHKTVSIKLTHL